MADSIKLLKYAASSQMAGSAVAKLINAVAKGSVKAVNTGAGVGEGLAQGLGVNPAVGRIGGGAATIGAGAAGVKELDKRFQRWKYQRQMRRYQR